MATHYKYVVEVSFNKGTCINSIGACSMPYYHVAGINKADSVVYYKKSIRIVAVRKDFYNASDILHKPTLTIHQVLERAIMLYYANCTNFPLINKITITATCPDTALNFRTSTNKSTTPQLFNFAITRSITDFISPTSNWLSLDKKGNALRISLSYWLEAISTSVSQIRFERAWTAFNTIYTYYGKYKREDKNHGYIKDQIRNNAASFTESLAISSSLTYTQLRAYRWKKWTKSQIERKYFGILESIMTPITDNRLKQVFVGIFASRDITTKFADSTNPVKDADLRAKLSNIQTSLSTPGVTNDMEVTLFLCVNYAYFLRNRRFHGCSENSFCKISPSAEDTEFESISKRLITLVKELYNAENIIVENPTP